MFIKNESSNMEYFNSYYIKNTYKFICEYTRIENTKICKCKSVKI